MISSGGLRAPKKLKRNLDNRLGWRPLRAQKKRAQKEKVCARCQWNVRRRARYRRGGPDALTDTPQGGEHTGTSCPTGDTDRDMWGATALTRASSGMRMTSFSFGQNEKKPALKFSTVGRWGGFGERSGLLANSVCFVSKSVLWCFAVFCGCFVVFCACFLKNSVFAVFCGCFAMFWTCFANVFCRHFLSERKTHSTVLRYIAQRVFCSFCAFCIFVGLFCAVL